MVGSVRYRWLASSALGISILVAFACGDDDSHAGASGSKRDAAEREDAAVAETPDAAVQAKHSIGSACSSNDDCGDGTCQTSVQVVNTPYPGGYCTAQCRTDDQCGDGAICVPGLRGQMGSCFLGCTAAIGCSRDGYLCRVVNDVGRCVPGSKPLGDDVAGSVCASDEDCGGAAMSCLSKLGDLDAPGGYCSQSCAIDSDCGASGKCINGLGFVTINSGKCYRTCDANDDCRADYVCRSLSGAVDEPGVCVPAGSADAGI
jgi:hypothetical protein